MHKYKVECLECGKSDILTIDDLRHQVMDYENKMNTNFQSFRFRGDQQWGFFCECGNDNRLAPKEANDFDKLVKGDELSLKNIAASLLIPDEKQFEIRRI